MPDGDGNSATPKPPPLPSPPSFKDYPINHLISKPNQMPSIEDQLDFLVRQSGCDGEIIFQRFEKVDPITQIGPTCGMVALAMALRDKSPSPSDLKNLAKKSGWSFNGEMFSCEWMALLAKNYGDYCAHVRGGLGNHVECIIDCLSKGGKVVVPYDKSKNNSPGLFEGKFAHWACLTGFAIQHYGPGFSDDFEVGACSCIQKEKVCTSKCSHHVMKWCHNEYLNVVPAEKDVKNAYRIYVTAYQGLSRHVQVWSFAELAASNDNLKVVNPTREDFVVLPEGGVEAGLRGQALLFFKP